MPLSWMKDAWDIGKDLYNEHKEGQARDEARGVRAGDIERDEKWRERGSISGRIKEGMRMGLSRSAAAGIQPSGDMTATVGQDTSYLNMSRAGQNYHPNNKLERELLAAQIEGVKLENLKKQQNLETPVTDKPGAGFYPGSTGNSHAIKEIPQERTMSKTGYSEPGAVVSLGSTVFPDNSVMVTPSQDLKQKIEDDPLAEFGFHINARTLGSAPPKSALPRGYDMWAWNPVTNTFTPARSQTAKAYNAAKNQGGFWRSSFGWSKGGKPSGSNLKYGPGRTYKMERR